MARLRRAKAAVVNGVPAELTDPAAPAWHDPRLFLELAAVHGLELHEPAAGPAAPCGKRRSLFLAAWARSNEFMSTQWPTTLDHERLRAHGVDGLRNWPTCVHGQGYRGISR